MKSNKEVAWYHLKNSYKPSDFSFKTTDELEPKKGLIGQEDAIKALEFGLKLDNKGYNMYISGDKGMGLYECVEQRVTEVAKAKTVPKDLCYIYNFEDKTKPISVLLDAGEGVHFKEDMREFIEFLTNELPTKLEEYDVEKKRKQLLKKLEDEKEDLVKDLKKVAKSLWFSLEVAEEGIVYVPLNQDNVALTEEEFDKLSVDEQEKVKSNLKKLTDVSEDVVKTLKETEKVYKEYLKDIDEEVVLKEIGSFIKHLNEAYGEDPKINKYLNDLTQDVISNITLFAEPKEETSGIESLFPWISVKTVKEVTDRYEVNLLVDHSKSTCAPVIANRPMTYSGLVGQIKVNSDFSGNQTNLMNLRAGILHEANGGYLIVYARDLLEKVGVWEAIKNVVKTERLTIENLQTLNIATTIGLVPEEVEAKMKVILVGSYEIYSLLQRYDDEFKELFKMNIDFDNEIDNNKEGVYEVARKLQEICIEENLPSLTIGGVLRLVEYSNRQIGTKEKMLADVSKLYDIVREAAVLVDTYITEREIEEVLEIRSTLKNRIDKRNKENYEKQIFLIQTDGKRIGQINGLGVQQIDDLKIGNPIKITATTYKGRAGVINVEKAAGLSGNIHTKGVEIIQGFLGQQFARENPLSLSCRICMEQSYGMVDGDSASSAELYAILSSLAEVGIDQGIAVTGSINQYGQIQPIGGVNAKIEGFYNVCKLKGLTGKQGVIIPWQNVEELILKEEIIEAVKNNVFHIYAVKDYKEGIEILTGYNYGDLHDVVMNKLRGDSRSQGSLRNRARRAFNLNNFIE